MMEDKKYVSGGRNPNHELTCGFPRCAWLDKAKDKDGGWCAHDANRAHHRDGGFKPSVSSTGGCIHHTARP
jgi:hypothetical protein